MLIPERNVLGLTLSDEWQGGYQDPRPIPGPPFLQLFSRFAEATVVVLRLYDGGPRPLDSVGVAPSPRDAEPDSRGIGGPSVNACPGRGVRRLWEGASAAGFLTGPYSGGKPNTNSKLKTKPEHEIPKNFIFFDILYCVFSVCVCVFVCVVQTKTHQKPHRKNTSQTRVRFWFHFDSGFGFELGFDFETNLILVWF